MWSDIGSTDRQSWFEGASGDIRLGLRLMGRSPGFAAAVILLLAIGIGGTTAVFSVVKTVLLTPLPYSEPDRVTMLWETEPNGFTRVPVSQPNFLDWQDRSTSFEAMAAVNPRYFTLAGGEEPLRITGAQVTSGLFDVLQVSPALGRSLRAEDDQEPGGRVVVLSHSLWSRSFAGSPEVIGEEVLLGDVAYTVVGVMPAGFDVITPWTLELPMDVLVPFPLSSKVEDRNSHGMMAMGRLAENVTIGQAKEEMTAIAAALESDYPDTNTGHGARVAVLHEEVVGRVGIQVMLLFGAAVLALLIACANVGGMLLAQRAGRQGELAVRCSLGASRGRLLRQLLVESAPLVAIGGGAGVAIAAWSLAGFRAMIPDAILRVSRLAVDGWVLGFAVVLSLLAMLVLGLAPAVTASRVNLSESLHQGRGGTPALRGRNRSRQVLVVLQLALTVVLANGAALMLASYGKLQRTDLGFEEQNVLTTSLQLAEGRYMEFAEVTGFVGELLPRLRSLPGVEHAAVTSKLPLHGGTNGRVVIEGREGDWGDEEGPLVERSIVSPEYFQTMGISLVSGRLLEEHDLTSDLAVAVVNQAMAQDAWPGDDPIGRRFEVDPASGWITVVGVVADVRQWGPERPPIPESYFPLSAHQAYWYGWGNPMLHRSYAVARTTVAPETLFQAVKRQIRVLDPRQPVSDLTPMAELVRSANWRRQFNTVLFSLFAAIGLFLVTTGIYGLMSSFVSHRRHEIGVRMALGATASQVLRRVLRESGKLLLIAAIAGSIGAFSTTRVLAGLVYGISPTDPLVLASGTLFVALVAVLGSLLPALRAARTNPASALRADT